MDDSPILLTDRHNARMRRTLRGLLVQRLQPPPRLTMSRWAAQHLHLSREEGPDPGVWRPDRAPFQAEIMDSLSDPTVQEVTVMSSSQVGKTTIAKAAAGYFMAMDPSPILYVQSTLDMAESFSKDRLAPMLRDSPTLTRLVDDKARDAGNTLLHKVFPGGHLTMAGANSAASLASRPIRVLLLDEVDRYPASAGAEGDPVNLAVARTSNFWNRKILKISSPSLKADSRISQDYEASDQRRFNVPCPHCDHLHALDWEHVMYNRDDPEDLESAAHVCPSCGGLYGDQHKPAMMARGRWVAAVPGRSRKGYQISQLYSPWVLVSEIVRKWHDTQGKPEQIKTFYNTVLGLPYEEAGDTSDASELAKRREAYSHRAIPSGVLLLVAGVDVQDDRLEVEILGLGREEECWGVLYVVLMGDPAQSDVWRRLDELLLADMQIEDGRVLRVRAAAVDSGGHHTQAVYAFCQPRAGRNIWAIKGAPGPRPIWPIRASKSTKYKGFAVRLVGVDTAKDLIHARLKLKCSKDEAAAGVCHFPGDYDDSWFDQLTIERRVTTYSSSGQMIRTWIAPKGKRNETLDVRVYAWAAYQGLTSERRLNIQLLALAHRELPFDATPSSVKTHESLDFSESDARRRIAVASAGEIKASTQQQMRRRFRSKTI